MAKRKLKDQKGKCKDDEANPEYENVQIVLE